MSELKPLDLSMLVRHAFLSGRGLKEGDRLSEEDQAAWAAYEPPEKLYERVSKSLNRVRCEESRNA